MKTVLLSNGDAKLMTNGKAMSSFKNWQHKLCPHEMCGKLQLEYYISLGFNVSNSGCSMLCMLVVGGNARKRGDARLIKGNKSRYQHI